MTSKDRRSVKVAIVQNHLGRDGRSRTIAPIIQLLNERNLIPDVISFSGADEERVFREISPSALSFRLVHLKRPAFLIGDLLQETLLPILLRRRLRRYSLVVGSSTAARSYPDTVQLIRLVYFPLEQVPSYEERYSQLPFRVYGAICRILLRLTATNTNDRGFWIANSKFTQEVMASTYGLSKERISVVYPPIQLPEGNLQTERQPAVASLGGFHPDKRQLEQIEIARRMPHVRFEIMGDKRSPAYFGECQRAAETLPNVRLVPNAPWSDIQNVLSSAKVFLHSKHNEHFGMSTVEAVAHGCIPLVHDSGGQREVVEEPALRFQRDEDVPALIDKALSGELDGFLPILQKHVQRYSSFTFHESFKTILNEALETVQTSAKV